MVSELQQLQDEIRRLRNTTSLKDAWIVIGEANQPLTLCERLNWTNEISAGNSYALLNAIRAKYPPEPTPCEAVDKLCTAACATHLTVTDAHKLRAIIEAALPKETP
jgi:hypothetical protein